MSQIIPCDEPSLRVAAERLRGGLLVALPTETVYGLGANAYNDEACKQIYKVKGRPSTDPLICHVPTIEDGARLWRTDSEEDKAIVKLALQLGGALWPGPLTIVAAAADRVAPSVTGGSGFVGVRIPNHPVALALLRAAEIPVAAPSANTFGHVSPTTAEHVLQDLGARDPSLRIVDGGSCTIGIESTVVKITSPTTMEILRRGMISVANIKAALRSDDTIAVTVRDTRTKYKVSTEVMDGPGQLLTHYSPTVPSFLVTPSEVSRLATSKAAVMLSNASSSQQTTKDASSLTQLRLSTSVDYSTEAKIIVIDFANLLKPIVDTHSEAVAEGRIVYRSLSTNGSATEASHNVFDALRWTETVPKGAIVLLPFISEFTTSGCVGDDELLFAVEDRLFRAASGRVVAVSSS